VAYTAVKLEDVQKAISAIEDAEKAYADEKAKLVPSKTALENAIKNRDTALAKFNDIKNNLEKTINEDSRYATASKALQEKKDALSKAQQYYDSKQYLKDNSAYQNALTAYNNAVTEANKITQYRDSGDYLRDDNTYQGALNLLRTREEELKKANDFRNSPDRINNDSDVKYNRQKVEDSKKAGVITRASLTKPSHS
jgi:tetratricopeptide (TPR) repeat protein